MEMKLRPPSISTWFPALLIAALVFGSARVATAQQLVAKKCGACGAAVGLGAQVGQTCPHCGATWSYEEDSYVSGYSEPSYSHELTERERWLLWQLMLQQMQMQRPLTPLERRALAMQKFVEREKRIREERRKKLIEKMEELRAKDNPRNRAAEYLEEGLTCEEEGDQDAAAAYFRLTMRTLPESSWADSAEQALARVEGR
jgi:hypothetical protein